MATFRRPPEIPTLIDWDRVQPGAVPAEAIPREIGSWVKIEDARRLHDLVLKQLASLRRGLDPSGVLEATGAISFATLDEAVRRADRFYADAGSDPIAALVAADYLGYVYERGRKAYKGKTPAIDAIRRTAGAVGDTIEDAIVTAVLVVAALGVGAFYLLPRVSDALRAAKGS